jgi:pyruvate dehydrogenase complex dehydrogenase (E1) component
MMSKDKILEALTKVQIKYYDLLYDSTSCEVACHFEDDIVEIKELLAQPEQDKAGAVMPNGVCVSNVYDAYEEGRKSVMSEQEPEPLLAETKIEWYGKGFRQGVNEFAPPKPLTEDVIYALDKEGVVENMDDHQVRYVIRWIRRVEKAHGIGGGNE